MTAVWTRRQTWGALVLAVTLPFAAAHAASTIMVQDNTGDVQIPLQPKTVLVYDLGALDIIQSIGSDVQGVPNQAIPASLAKYRDTAKYPPIGSLLSLTTRRSRP